MLYLERYRARDKAFLGGGIVQGADPDKIDVNVRCLDDVDLATVSVKTFDGRNWETATQQRVPWR